MEYNFQKVNRLWTHLISQANVASLPLFFINTQRKQTHTHHPRGQTGRACVYNKYITIRKSTFFTFSSAGLSSKERASSSSSSKGCCWSCCCKWWMSFLAWVLAKDHLPLSPFPSGWTRLTGSFLTRLKACSLLAFPSPLLWWRLLTALLVRNWANELPMANGGWDQWYYQLD